MLTTRTSRLVAGLAFTALASTAFGTSLLLGDDFDLSWNTIDGGGGTSFSGDFSIELTGTIGQPDAGPTIAGSTFELAGGFWGGGGPSETDPIATITAYTMIKGTRLAGGIPELIGSDNAYFHTRSGIGNTFVDLHNMEVRIDLDTDVPSPTLLDLQFETRIDNSAGTGQVRLWNWNTSQYQLVGSFALGLSDQVRQINNVNAANYVNAQGEIRMSVKHLVFVPQFAYFFQSFLDQVQVTVE
jgi:hypothetical protein